MRVLFLLANSSKSRHFEGVLHDLATAGHTIVIGAERTGGRPVSLTKQQWLTNRDLSARKQPGRIQVIPCPTDRVDAFDELAPSLRRLRDYLRFIDPRYARAEKLQARCADATGPAWQRFIASRPWITRHVHLIRRLLALVEAAVPAPRFFELFILHERPDLVVVTPLVNYGSYQTDYVKAAHHLGIPVVFAPFSWDNLTNRGVIHVEPDQVLVWNDLQRKEAIELHGVHGDRVVVTGAPRFDDFFAMAPATTREAFHARLGLDPSRPTVLYICSSEFVAPHEVDFVRRWIAAVRGSDEPALRTCGVLVRPHPAHLRQWEGVALDAPNTALWSDKESMNADQGLYDSLHHAAAVVGLNTSAMIEAGVLGKSVLTLVLDEFAGGQEQTLHFHYLRASNGGLLTEAHSLQEHLAQLVPVLEGRVDPEPTRQFVARFVRPRGVERPVAPIMARHLEQAATITKPAARSKLWHLPIRLALRLVATRRRRPARTAQRARRRATS